MEGGYGKIHKHPKHNSNGFKERPQDSGRNKKPEELEVVMGRVLSDPKTMEDIVRKVADMAKKGNIKAVQLLWEHAYGKPRQRIEIEGGEDIGRNAPTKTVLIQYRTDSIPENDSSSGGAEGNGDANKQGQ